jgi:hypothetical protein
VKVRVSATVLRYLEGTQAWQEPERDDPWAAALMGELRAAPRRSDGSVIVELADRRHELLREYAGYLESAALDDAGHDATARGEVNAARALIRQIDGGGYR